MSATTVALDVACGGVSTAVVSAILNPTDVIKTRRQIVGFSGASPLDMARAVAPRRRPTRTMAAGPAGDGPARAAVQRLHEGPLPLRARRGRW